jgi:hypothetical protein
MDQRDERLDVTLTERLVCGANRVNGHPVRVLRGRRSADVLASKRVRSNSTHTLNFVVGSSARA